MDRIFEDYEDLQCDICDAKFSGRKFSDDTDILCPECIEAESLPIEDDLCLPVSIDEEVTGGRGEDDE